MTRVATTDLFLLFTMGATSFPTATIGGNIITALYKETYTIMYGPGNYSADDSTDTSSLVNIDDVFVIIQSEASDICDAYHFAGIDLPKPSIQLSRDAKMKLREIKRAKLGFIQNIRMWGEAEDDVLIR